MKKNLFVISMLALLATITNCSKKEATTEPESSAGTPTEKGKPVGTAVSKSIGPNGGTLSTADKRISLDIPQGAVGTATTFSIQPIENFAPNGVGLAYRLLPEGTHFSKPVTLRFTYDDSLLTGTVPTCLFVAYQGEDNVWKAQEVQLDEGTKTITATATHFSDWTMFSNFRLAVAKSTLDPNESTTLVVKETIFDLVDLRNGKNLEVTTSRKITEWALSGEGQLSHNGATATYTAPDHVPATNPVTVSAELNNLVTNSGPRGKVILLAAITVSGEYLDLNIGGASYHLTQCHSLVANGVPMLIGNGAPNISVAWYVGGFNTGTYQIDHTGATTFVNIGYAGHAYGDSWSSCNPAAIHNLESYITISKMGATNEYIEGSFGGQVGADYGSCSYDVKSISGTFRIKRRF